MDRNAAVSNRTASGAAYAAAKARVVAGGDAHAEACGLLAQMTASEKLECLDGDTDFWPGLIDMAGGDYYRRPFPAAAVVRLGFPGISFTDGPRGIVVGASTCFPVTMARGATFDPALEERIGEAIGIEARIQGANFYGGVCVNLLRHPRWGRAQETYGEDPFHVGEMGAALARGVQRHVMACVKHFACNSIENARFVVDVEADSEVLDDIYLRHFRRIVDEGVAAVMTSYNSLNGEWCGQSRELIRNTLRERWGFRGIVVSDFVYGLHDAAESVRAGLDIEMPFRQQRARHLPAALEDGSLSMDEVEACALRVLETVLRFDAATPDDAPDPSLLAGTAHRALAREAAAESIVLLRNEAVGGAPLLPLCATDSKRIALVGRLADRPNLGDGGSSDVHPPSVVTIAKGLREAFPHAEWTEDPSTADLAIVVAGYTQEDEGEFTGGFSPELAALMSPAPDPSVWDRLSDALKNGMSMATGGDRASLRLRAEDEELIVRVSAVQPRTVVLMVGGSAILVEPWIDSVPAVLQVWYPGMEGGRAIADVLTGAAEPAGRLPFAVPTEESHLAHFDPDAKSFRYDAWHGQWLLDRDAHAARYPFGFGLSYAGIRLTGARREGQSVVVDARNESAVAGSAVVFAFREHGPTWRLAAFRKVKLAATATSSIALPAAHGDRMRVGLSSHDPASLDVPSSKSPQ